MFKSSIYKACAFCVAGAVSLPGLADDKADWVDMSDPTAVYSNASIGGGSEGVDISATYGGYLGGAYKHRFNAQVRNDLDYYEFNYLLLNSSTKSGIDIETDWSKDARFNSVDYKNTNDVTLSFFAKLGIIEDGLFIYPKMGVGYMWADDMSDTTYVRFDATTRYTLDKMFWVGVTPTYIYGMKGVEINEWSGTFDIGIQLSESFGLSASVNDDKEWYGKMMFAF